MCEPRPRRIAVSRRLKQAAVVFIIVFAAAQFVRPERANPATDARRTIRAHMGTASGLVAVLDRACRLSLERDHVAGYTQVAPVSWLMAQGVTEGRKAVKPGRSEHSRRTERAVKLDRS
ncbi:MAG: hypothetical protein DMF90_20150 [Acidobacteria bacterium]|nr:MAG: hypothetical protein DMF90_20150 [Acidobacteriota bacterium]